MRFFEFKQEYEYYALIAVPSVDGNFDSLSIAIETYADYNEYYLGCLPSELTIDEAFEEYRGVGFGDTPKDEISKRFYTMLDKIENNGVPAIILIDSDLI